MRTLLFFAAAAIATVVQAAVLQAAVLQAVFLQATVLQAAAPVERGRELFSRQWQPQEPSKTQGDGLGPYFNERSCAGCHKLGGVGGAGPNENNVQLIALQHVPLDKRSQSPINGLFPPDNRVLVLHRQATFPDYAQVRLTRLVNAAPQNLEVKYFRPTPPDMVDLFYFDDKHYRPSLSGAFEERNTPALFGAGLIDLVSPELLQLVARCQPEEIRGRPAWLGEGKIGRFGWKAQNASLLDFCENACAVELGLETPRRQQTPPPPERRAPGKPVRLTRFPAMPDMTAQEVEELTLFVGDLSAPRRVLPPDVSDEDVALGEFIFTGIGCAECHTPNLGEVTGIYSDLLLHRVGTSGLAYYQSPLPPPSGDIVSGKQFAPVGADEFRTPPLWGVADSAPYMHDGSAYTLQAAVEVHGLQAARAGRQYRSLNGEDRRRLFAFLGSLRAPNDSRPVPLEP